MRRAFDEPSALEEAETAGEGEAHAPCGDLIGDATRGTGEGYLLSVACLRGVRFDRWVTTEAAVEELVFSRPVADNN